MNIYFTASMTNDGKFKEQYQKIIAFLKKNHHLLSGDQIVQPKLRQKDTQLTKEEIFKREKNLIERADCVIAEVSQPSLGVGGEIVYALVHNKAVLGLVYENYKDSISPMIVGNPSDNFFLEYYNSGKLPYILKEFLEHIETVRKRKGCLIVIDGGDGSGKTTQAKLLLDYLKSKKFPVKYVDFPQYYSSFHGKTVARFLRGEFGTIDQVSPYLAALAFAVDRASIKQEMTDFLQTGGYIVANRYATSSMAHQAAKFLKKKDRDEFLDWIYDLEYKVHKIPKENLVIYVYVPWQIGLSLTGKKGNRSYLNGLQQDIHEKDLEYRKQVESMYRMLAKKYRHWVTVNCHENDKILPPKIIHQKILDILKKTKYID